MSHARSTAAVCASGTAFSQKSWCFWTTCPHLQCLHFLFLLKEWRCQWATGNSSGECDLGYHIGCQGVVAWEFLGSSTTHPPPPYTPLRILWALFSVFECLYLNQKMCLNVEIIGITKVCVHRGLNAKQIKCFCLSSGKYPTLILRRSEDDPKVIPKQSQSDTKAIPKRYQSGPKTIPKSSQNDAKVIPKRAQSHPRALPEWSRNHPKAIP